MESLPSLAVEKILICLDVADLLACSLVSVGWRSVVNNDRVWKKVCHNQCNKHTIDYLQSVPSKVLPRFENPDIWQTTLEPLCHWRTVFMKIQHVKGNWWRANHDVYSVTEFAYNHFDLKIDKNILIAIVNDNQCEVWNIQHVPYKQEIITCALKNTRCKCMIHLFDDKLVIIQDTLMQVYLKSDKTFKLCFRRLFNQVEANSENIPRSLNIDEWYNERVKLRPTHLQAFHVGNYFIGLAENGTFEKASFHIWDMMTGSKLKEQSIKELYLDNSDPVYNVKFCPPRTELEKILVCVQHSQQTGNDTFYTVVYVYDLESLSPRAQMILKPHVPWIYFEDHLIITISHNQSKLNIYNSTSGAKIVSKQYENIINPDSVQVHGDHLGFSTGGQLVVLKIQDFDLVFTTSIFKFSSNLFGFDFVFLDWNLILISQWDTINKIEVWSIEKKCLLSTLKASGLMFPCNNSAKFFVWNEMLTTIYMLQFW